MNTKLIRVYLVFCIALIVAMLAPPAPEEAASKEKAAFTDSLAQALHKRVSVIFKKSCATAGCHGGAYPKARLSLEPEKMLAALKNVPSRQIDTLKLVDTTRPERSYVAMKIRGGEGIEGVRMPLEAPPLSSEEITTIELWAASLAVLEKAAPAAGAGSGKKKALNEGNEGEGPDSGARAFSGNTLINLPTTEALGKGEALFRISHRFSLPIDAGHEYFLGLDGPAHIFISFGYGVTDRASVTLGRTNLRDEIELSSKVAIIRQGAEYSVPFSAALAACFDLTVERPEGAGIFDSDNRHYGAQLILARRFTDRFSFLCVPSFSFNTHMRRSGGDPGGDLRENTTALGLGSRFLVFENVSLMGEWIPVLSGYETANATWGVGIEAKKGGHVFHFFVNDASGLTLNQYLPGGDLSGNTDVRLGFNIYRSL